METLWVFVVLAIFAVAGKRKYIQGKKLNNYKEKKAKLVHEHIPNGCLLIFIKESSFKFEQTNGGDKTKSLWKYAKIKKKRPNERTTKRFQIQCQMEIEWMTSIWLLECIQNMYIHLFLRLARSHKPNTNATLFEIMTYLIHFECQISLQMSCLIKHACRDSFNDKV